MESGEFENSPLYKDMLFIGENMQRSYFDLSTNKKSIIFKVKTKDKKIVKEYSPYDYFRFCLTYFGRVATTENTPSALDTLYQGKANMVMQSESINVIVKLNPECMIYDFSGYPKQFDVLIEKAQSDLQSRVLISQISTNENTVKTNFTVKCILVVTAAIYFLQLIVSMYAICANKNEIPNQLRIWQQDSAIKTMETRLYQKENQEVYNLHEIDSLKNALDSAHY